MWVSAYCARVNNFSKHYTNETITKDSEELKDGGLKFLTLITKPNGILPVIGDTKRGRPVKAAYPGLKKLSWFPYYQYLVSGGNLREKPKETTMIFPDSGYYIYRDKWDQTGKNSATQIIFKCGFLAKGHRHNDD